MKFSSKPTFKRILFYTNLAFSVAFLVAAAVTLTYVIWPTSGAIRIDPVGPAIVQQGEAAPNFILPSMEGVPFSLDQQRGQVVIVNMWATWCPPCKAEMPMLDAFHAAHAEKGVLVLAVNNEETPETVRAFISEAGFTFPVLFDQYGQIQDSYGVQGLPTTFVIDRNGLIQYIHLGEITEERLLEVIEPLL